VRRHAKASPAGSTSRRRRPALLAGFALLVSLPLVSSAAAARPMVTIDPSPAVGCPNAALRAENNSLELPECRTYEMVTSPFKEGFSATAPIDYAEDGSALAYRSGGIFAGAGLGQIANTYLATRSGAGWQTTSNSASGPIYAGAGGPLDLAANLRSSVNVMRLADQPSNVQSLYLRASDGSFTLIGPGVNPAKLAPAGPGSLNTGGGIESFVGSSADLSHVAYEVHAPSETFPGDTTATGGSLYEYVGTGHDYPRLVGLDNSGQLVSDCGTVAGANQSKFNAISSDGRVFFFTAAGGSCGSTSLPAAEVWARVDGTTSYEASQSHCTRTAGEPGGACNAPADARFEGASADGSRVYFTTTQQLVDGDTDETSDLYAYDLPTASNPSPSPPLVEVSGSSSEARVERVVRVSDDGSRVYFIASGAVLAANADALGEPAAYGDHNLYAWQRDASHPAGETTFVARLVDDDVAAETTSNGRYLLLSTKSPLLETDTDDAEDVYRYDVETGTMLRLSTDTAGAGGNAAALDSTFATASGFSLARATRRLRSSISADGGAVIFETAEALSPADVNDANDVYLWRAGHLSLISVGGWPEGIGDNGLAYIDGSGDDVYFSTTEPITPADADTTVDFYDARVGGGFSFPRPESCAADGCQGAPSSPPSDPAWSTDRAGGTGNVEAAIVSVKALTAADRAKLANGARVQLKVKVNRAGRVLATGTARIDGKRRQVFSSALTAGAAGGLRLPISLSKDARGQLQARGSLTVQLAVRFADAPVKTAKLELSR
jgi:hypothetical protein